MRYLLDTNVCIEILRGRHAVLKARLDQIQFDDLALSSVVWAELHFGAQLAGNPAREAERVNHAFGKWLRLPFDDAPAEIYARIRTQLHRSGSQIGANDLLIAATALAHDLILVTHNTGEFSRVPGLQIEDWQT